MSKLRSLMPRLCGVSSEPASRPAGAAATLRRLRRWALMAGLSLSSAVALAAPISAFTVGVNAGPGAPTTVSPGQDTVLRITLTNADTTQDFTGVHFVNPLAPTTVGGNTLQVTGPATISGGAGCSLGTVTVAPPSGTINLTGMTVPMQVGGTPGQCFIDVPIRAVSANGTSSSPGYTLGVDSVQMANGDGNSTGGSQQFTVTAVSRPTWGKSFSPATAVLNGGTVNLVLSVTNPASVPLTGVQFTDVFPTAGGQPVIVATGGAPTFSAGCTNTPTVSAANGAGQVVVSGLTVAAGQSCQITVPVRANQTNGAYELQNQTNTLQTGSFSSNEGLTPANNASANVTVRSPLRVTKSTPTYVASGVQSAFTITLYNDSANPLPVTQFNENEIDGGGVSGARLTPVSATNSCGANPVISGNGFTSGGYSIPANGSCVITVNFTGTTTDNNPLTFTNSIPLGAVQTSTSGIVSQPASATTTIVDQLRVTKSVLSNGSAAPGSPVQYSVTVYNYSSTPLSSVHVRDNLLNGSTYLTGTHGGIDRSPTLSPAGCGVPSTASTTGATGTIDFTIPNLAARSGGTPGACTLTFWVITGKNATSDTGNRIEQCGVYYGTPGNPATCNGSPSEWAGVNRLTALTAEKTFTTNYTDGANNRTAPEGTVVTMRIRVRNNTDQPVTGLTLNDPLPLSSGSPLRIASPANASSTCGATPTANPGDTSVAFNGGTVPARSGSTAGECVFQVDVVGAAGTYPNRADVAGTQTYGDGTTGPASAQSNQATLTYTGALAASKVFSPTAMTTDGSAEVRITLRNNDSSATLTGVSVTDPLPAAPNGLRLASPAGLRTTCAGNPVMTGTPGSKSPTLTGATLPPGGSCDFIFNVVNDGTGTGNWVNTIPAGSVTANGGIVNQTPVSATLTRQSAVTPTISKGVSPTSVAPGQPAELTINIGNGSSAVTGLGVTDYFTVDGTPGGALNGMRIAASPNASSTCPGGIVTAVPGATSVALSGATLAASASCVVRVNVESTQPGAIVNTIPLNALVTDQGHTNSTTTGAATLQTSSNMAVSKQFTPSVMKAGERSRLRITFINPTILAVSNFKITDTLPAGLTVPAGPNVQQTCGPLTNVNVSDPTRVVITGGTLAAAVGGVPSSCYVELDVTANADGAYTNTIPGSSLEVGCRADGTGCTTVPHPPTTDIVRVVKPLVAHKAIATLTLDTNPPAGMTTGTASSAAGVPAILTIRLDNPNTMAVTETTFVDNLPQGMAVAQTPNAGTTCVSGVVTAAPSGTSVRLTGATVPAGGFCAVTVNVLSNTAGRYTNTIPSGGVTTKEGVTTEAPTSAELLVSTPPTVGKQFTPAVIPPSGTSRLTIALGNSNGTQITLTQALVDTLPTAPGAMLVASPPNIGGSCTGTVTAVAGGTTVTYANGAIIPAGGCTIEVNVTASVAGVYNNNIPAGGLRTNVGSNADPANAPLTVSTKGYVSGKVFQDNNVTPNGTFEQGTDTPIAGVTVELRAGATCSAPLVTPGGTTVTDAMGNYTFANLEAGTYSVCQPSQPSGTVNGTTTAGTIAPVNGSTGTPGTASNPTGTSSQVAGIVLNANGAGEVSGSVNNNFAEVALSSITGRVFLDQNNNGAFDGSDSGIAGVTVELLNSSGTVIRTVQTAADGSYRFDDLPPGTYSVREPQQPPNTSNGETRAGAVPNGGTAGTATPVATPVSQITNIVLPPNTVASGNNFAEIPNGRSISGAIFLDHNNNGTRDSNDTGIANQTVTLEGIDVNGNTVTRTTTTDADGNYRFEGLPEGTYTVRQPAQPGGTTNGTPRAGTTGGTPSNPTSTSSQIAGINLTGSNTVSANNLFPEVPGNGVDLTLRKTHTVSSFGQGSSRGFFILTPSNVGTDATEGPVRVVDTLPMGMTVAAPLPSGQGWVCTAQVGGSTVDCTSNDVIAGGGAQGRPITVYVAVAQGTAGQVLTNRAVVSNDKEPDGFRSNNEAFDTVTVTESASLSGTVWRDTNHDNRLDPNEAREANWIVEVLQGGVLVATTRTGADGTYQVTDLAPGSGYEVRFRDPVSGLAYGKPVTNETGLPSTPGVVSPGNPGGVHEMGYSQLTGITLNGGDHLVQQSLPLDPGGVVYDSVTRQPIQGATVTITGPAGFDPSIHISHGRGSVVTGPSGYYEFWLLPGAPAGVYTLSVSEPSHMPGASSLIPPCTNAPLNVTGVYNPEVIQAGSGAPGLGVPAHDPAACVAGSGPNTTQYYYSFVLTVGTSGNVVNNHLPLDPVLGGAIVVSKTSPKVNVTKGELVPYTITATNTLQSPLGNVDVQDYIPPGFRYRTGSATYNGMPMEPVVSGRTLTWRAQSFAPAEKKTYQLLLMVGAGVGEGEYVNQAWALNSVVQERMSNVANATVRVVPDPTFDCSDLIGKVFDDKNANGYQDQGELGIPNVRVVTARGLLVTTDAEGRFHVACAAIPQADRGSNFVMKLDERTLPSGYRLTTENPRDVRVTRGKMVKLNFGATVHKVLRLEVDARAFAQDGDALAQQWSAKVEPLLAQLAERPTVLRIAYRLTGEGKDVAERRLKALTQRIHDGYAEQAKRRKDKEDDTPPLVIETESFEQNKAKGAAK